MRVKCKIRKHAKHFCVCVCPKHENMSGCSTKLGCKPGIFVVFSVVFATCFLGTTPRVKHPIGNENPKWHESGLSHGSACSCCGAGAPSPSCQCRPPGRMGPRGSVRRSPGWRPLVHVACVASSAAAFRLGWLCLFSCCSGCGCAWASWLGGLGACIDASSAVLARLCEEQLLRSACGEAPWKGGGMVCAGGLVRWRLFLGSLKRRKTPCGQRGISCARWMYNSMPKTCSRRASAGGMPSSEVHPDNTDLQTNSSHRQTTAAGQSAGKQPTQQTTAPPPPQHGGTPRPQQTPQTPYNSRPPQPAEPLEEVNESPQNGRALPQRPYHEGHGDQRMRGKRFKTAVQTAYAQRGWVKRDDQTWKEVARRGVGQSLGSRGARDQRHPNGTGSHTTHRGRADTTDWADLLNRHHLPRGSIPPRPNTNTAEQPSCSTSTKGPFRQHGSPWLLRYIDYAAAQSFNRDTAKTRNREFTQGLGMLEGFHRRRR